MNVIPFLHTSRRRVLMPPAIQPMEIGSCIHPLTVGVYGDNQDLQFAKFLECGMTACRVSITFTSPTVHTVSNSTKVQEVITKGAAAGINIYPIVASGIDYTLTEAQNYTRGNDRGTAFATTWGANFRYIEIGNEIENQLYVTGDGDVFSNYDAVKYGKAKEWIRGVINGIIALRPAMKIVINAGWKHWGYTNKLISDGLQIDVIAWHWYSEMEQAYPIQIAQKLIALYPTKEIWFNEVNSRSTDPNVQATYMASFYNYLLQFPRINKMFVYELFNEPAHANPAERNYGMYIYNGDQTATAKPLADVFRNVPVPILYPPIVKTIAFFRETFIPLQPYLEPFLDYSLGPNEPRKFTRVSGPEWDSTETRYFHGYSKQQRENLDGTVIKILDQVLLHGDDYSFWKDVDRSVVGSGSSFWSNLDARKLYWFGTNKIWSINIDTNVATPIYTFSTSEWDSMIVNVGNAEGNIGIDDRNVMVTMKKAGIEYYIHFDLIAKAIISMRSYIQLGSDTPYNWSAISPYGNYIVCNKTTGTGNMGKQLYTKDWVYLGNLGRHSHMDFVLNENLVECMTSMGNPKFTNLATLSVVQNMKTSEMLAAWGDYGGHSSGQAMYGLPGWGCYSPHTPEALGGHDHYITMVKLVNSTLTADQEFMIFGHHRRGGNLYPNEVKAVPFRKGNKILFTSDWGQGNTIDNNNKLEYSYIVEMPTAEDIATLPKFGL